MLPITLAKPVATTASPTAKITGRLSELVCIFVLTDEDICSGGNVSVIGPELQLNLMFYERRPFGASRMAMSQTSDAIGEQDIDLLRFDNSRHFSLAEHRMH